MVRLHFSYVTLVTVEERFKGDKTRQRRQLEEETKTFQVK